MRYVIQDSRGLFLAEAIAHEPTEVVSEHVVRDREGIIIAGAKQTAVDVLPHASEFAWEGQSARAAKFDTEADAVAFMDAHGLRSGDYGAVPEIKEKI